MKSHHLLLFALFFCCCKDVADKEKESDPGDATKLPAIHLNCASAGESADGIPAFRLSAIEGDQVFLFADLPACETIAEADFAKYRIPATANEAAGGWYAGGGDYFYTLRETDKWLIKQGGMDEMQLTQSYGYRTIAVYENGGFKKVDGVKTSLDQVSGLYALGGHDTSWLVLIDQDEQHKIIAQFGTIDGMLPPLEDLPQLLEEYELRPLSQFDFDPTTLRFRSDKGPGFFKKTKNSISISFLQQKSHIADILTLEFVQR